MIRAPLRMSFVGGGTDLPDFYHRSPGRVLSATIDKYIYVLVNPTPLVDKFMVKYQKTELVDHPKDIQHTRVRAALLDLDITKSGIEIGSFADLPAKTGLGSSSSFAVALMKGLNAYLGKTLSREEAAEAASRLEIELLGEPIGKQDQYAASFGGFNIFQFNPDDSVDVESILLDYKKKLEFEDHILLFYTGITRPASSVLSDQKSKIDKNFETYIQMADSVFEFNERLLAGDIKGIAKMLHEGWARKKSLSSSAPNMLVDEIYNAGLGAGAWGGKILGAGGGGCVMFIAPPPAQGKIRERMQTFFKEHELPEGRELPIHFTHTGTDILLNNHYQNGF